MKASLPLSTLPKARLEIEGYFKFFRRTYSETDGKKSSKSTIFNAAPPFHKSYVIMMQNKENSYMLTSCQFTWMHIYKKKTFHIFIV